MALHLFRNSQSHHGTQLIKQALVRLVERIGPIKTQPGLFGTLCAMHRLCLWSLCLCYPKTM